MAVTEWTREVASTTGATTASITLNTITVAGASITDTTGAISFGDENLTTTGLITGATIAGTLTTAAQTNITSLGPLTALAVDNITIDANAITSTNTNGNITLTPNGTGDVELGADTVKIGDANANATLTTNGTGDLILNTNAGTNSSSITMKDGANGDIDILLNGSGQINIGVDGTGHDVKFFGDTASCYLLWDQSENRLHQVGTGQNTMRIESTLADANVGPALQIYRNSASPATSDVLGSVTYKGTNATDGSGSEVTYARIRAHILDATKGGEEGKYDVTVMANGTQTVGAVWSGQSDGTVDVNIGSGAASMTTLQGDLTVSGADVVIGADTNGTDRSITFGHGVLKSIMGIDDSQDKFAINTDAAFEDVNDFEINTNGTVTLGAGLLEIYQLGGNDYQPGFHFYNYDANNDNDQGFSQMVFYNSKSDTVAHTATDADAHLGRILFQGNAGGSDGFKYGGAIQCRQSAAWGSGDFIGSEITLSANARQGSTAAVSRNISWAPPATPAANNTPNLILNGVSANISQACGNQIIIKNGTAPSAHIDDYICIGAKNASSSSESTLELMLEEDPIADTDIMQSGDPASHKLKVWINGTEYYIALKSV